MIFSIFYRVLKVELYISALDHVRKLKYGSRAHMTSVNKLSDSVQCRSLYFQAQALYLSFKPSQYINTM